MDNKNVLVHMWPKVRTFMWPTYWMILSCLPDFSHKQTTAWPQVSQKLPTGTANGPSNVHLLCCSGT